MFGQSESLGDFPASLNRLLTTTKDAESICLVLERAPGIDLVEFNKLVQPRLKWDPDPSVFEFTGDLEQFLKLIAVQLFEGLEALHKADVIYKDVKASHVFINPEGKVTLIDFGLSEQVSEGTTL